MRSALAPKGPWSLQNAHKDYFLYPLFCKTFATTLHSLHLHCLMLIHETRNEWKRGKNAGDTAKHTAAGQEPFLWLTNLFHYVLTVIHSDFFFTRRVFSLSLQIELRNPGGEHTEVLLPILWGNLFSLTKPNQQIRIFNHLHTSAWEKPSETGRGGLSENCAILKSRIPHHFLFPPPADV